MTNQTEQAIKNGKRVELLAPAGNMEAFRGAVNAGADAVYLAGQQFGARAYADNFDEDQLKAVIGQAHLFGMRVYLTVNVLTRQAELEELESFVLHMYEAGLDGVIVQDLGVAASIKRRCPGLELHASTQMSVMGREAVRFLKEQGFVRVVPARELSLQEIRLLKEEDIEIESFIHGAMCYSYSGRCLMSSFLGGRSGNRGRCAGPCRLPYEIRNEKGEPAGKDGRCYPISMRDMCVLEILPELIDAGIDSFKIEGRMKKPEYVAGTVAVYRKYIDRFYAWDEKGRPGKWQIDKEDLRDLKSLYIRADLCQGYYHSRNGRSMLTIHEPGYKGAEDALLERIRRQYLEENRQIQICGEAYIHCNESVRLRVFVKGQEDCCAESTTELVAAPARNRALSREDIAGKLSKTGNSSFAFERLEIDTDEQSFLAVSALGELRRSALENLAAALRATQNTTPLQDAGQAAHYAEALNANGNAQKTESGTGESKTAGIKTAGIETCGIGTGGTETEEEQEKRPWSCLVMVQNEEQAKAVLEEIRENEEHAALVLDGAVRDNPESVFRILQEKKHCDLPVLAALPYILRESNRQWIRDYITKYGDIFYGFITRSLEELEILREREYDKAVIADSMLYAWNRESERVLKNAWETVGIGSLQMVLPLELDRYEMNTVYESYTDKILMVYGRIPLMMSAGCVRKTSERCIPQEGMSYYRLWDRTGAEFPVLTDCHHCQNVIYNSVPTSLHKFVKDPLLQKVGCILISFTTESKGEIAPVLRRFLGIQKGMAVEQPESLEFTNGHYKKGAM